MRATIYLAVLALSLTVHAAETRLDLNQAKATYVSELVHLSPRDDNEAMIAKARLRSALTTQPWLTEADQWMILRRLDYIQLKFNPTIKVLDKKRDKVYEMIVMDDGSYEWKLLGHRVTYHEGKDAEALKECMSISNRQLCGGDSIVISDGSAHQIDGAFPNSEKVLTTGGKLISKGDIKK